MKHFLVMGNTRIGSTWFLASMHALPNTYCTREIRWRMPYMDEAPPVHTYVDSTTRSMKERLESWLRIIGKEYVPAVGAKLKFDPYGYVPPQAFDDLGKIVEDDVHVIFLRRCYFEIFQTWKAFGIRHLVNPNAQRGKKILNDQGTWITAKLDGHRFTSMHSLPLERKRVFITSDGRVVARYLHNKYSGSDNIYYSVADAIDDLLVLFYNDLMALSVIAGHGNADVFYYQDIRSKFFEVTQRLGLPVSAEECEDVLDNASTSRIEPPEVDLVHPSGALKEISDHLDTLFHEVRSGDLAREEIVRVDLTRQTVLFHLPGLPAIFARHEETQALLQAAKTGPGRAFRRLLGSGRLPLRLRKLLAPNAQARGGTWHARRAIHVPVAVAPPPVAPAAKAVAKRASAV